MTKEVMKQEQDEPVAMRYDFDGYGYKYIDSGSGSDWQTRERGAEPLYTAPQPKREQGEPVATLIEHHAFTDGIVRFDGVENMEQLPVGTKLYTTPQQRKPLTRKDIDRLHEEDCFSGNIYEITAEIEAAHGIKE